MAFAEPRVLRAVAASAVALAAWLGPSCVEQQAGIEIPVTLVVEPAASASIPVAAGGTLTLQHAALTVSTLDLLPCGGDSSPDAGAESAAASARRRARALVASTAWAHIAAVPTHIDSSYIASLMPGASKTTDLGRFLPAPGHYCAVRVALVGDVVASYQPADGGAPLAAVVPDGDLLTVDAPGPAGGWMVTGPADAPALTLHLDASCCLAQIDPAALASDAADTLLGALRGAVRIDLSAASD